MQPDNDEVTMSEESDAAREAATAGCGGDALHGGIGTGGSALEPGLFVPGASSSDGLRSVPLSDVVQDKPKAKAGVAAGLPRAVLMGALRSANTCPGLNRSACAMADPEVIGALTLQLRSDGRWRLMSSFRGQPDALYGWECRARVNRALPRVMAELLEQANVTEAP